MGLPGRVLISFSGYTVDLAPWPVCLCYSLTCLTVSVKYLISLTVLGRQTIDLVGSSRIIQASWLVDCPGQPRLMSLFSWVIGIESAKTVPFFIVLPHWDRICRSNLRCISLSHTSILTLHPSPSPHERKKKTPKEQNNNNNNNSNNNNNKTKQQTSTPQSPNKITKPLTPNKQASKQTKNNNPKQNQPTNQLTAAAAAAAAEATRRRRTTTARWSGVWQDSWTPGL